MGTAHNQRPLATTPSEVRDRGAALLQRLRSAGIWQYKRWFLDKEPKWNGDASVQYRVFMILNGRGALTDAELLRKCEVLADRHLDGKRNAA